VKPAHKPQDLLTVRGRKQRGAAAAKIRSAEQEREDDAHFDKVMKRAERLLQAMRAADDPEEIAQEIAVRADELRRRGARDPVAQAEEAIAERLGHASGPALNRWLRRHR
jgi:hypothetical protein